jgi:DNA repair exonuclease SbcCD nuclease subunit
LDRNFGFPNPAKDLERKHDLNTNFTSVVEFAIENHADLFLITGDIFDRYLPSNSSQVFFASQIKKLHENKIKVLIIGGNHDVPRIGKLPVLAIDMLHITGLAEVFSGTDVLQSMKTEINGNDVTIYGKSYNAKVDSSNPLHDIRKFSNESYNILMVHGSLLGGGVSPNIEGMTGYNPFSLGDNKPRNKLPCTWALSQSFRTNEG